MLPQKLRHFPAPLIAGVMLRQRDSPLDRKYPFGYFAPVYHIKQTDAFADWLSGLRDNKAKARIICRMDSARLGNLGDCKSVGAGIREMRVHVGSGYRVYFKEQNRLVIFLLCGGSKSSQAKDIERAKQLALEIEE